MKKLSFFLMAMLFTCATTLQAAEVTETIAMKGFGGLTTASYENVTKTGTSDKGTEMVAYAFNPSTGQIRGNKTAIAGASVTSADKNKNWSLYNTQAMPGAIKKITVTQTATGTNMFKGNLYVALGTTNQGTVISVTGAQKNTTGTATEFTFDIDETQGYTYFKLLSNVAFTGGSVAGVVVTVTYVTAEGGEEEVTKYTVTANVNDPAMGAVSGAGEYAEGKIATLTANANAGYRFVNWSNGSTDNPLKITVTENIEITANFEAVPPMTCAEAAATADGTTVVLKPFDVVAVVKDAGYIYIEDESGVNLIYDYNLAKELKAGDHVEGFVGVSSPYYGLPELKTSVAYADLTVTHGTAPEPTLFTEAPVKADVNKYVKFENVTFTANVTYTAGSTGSNATMVVNGTNVTVRNTFKLAATLSKDKAYNLVGFVAVYNSTIQVYFLSIEEYVAPVVNHTITVSANPAEAGTVTGGGEFEETDEITVKAVANEGYEFVNWTEGETVVSTEANYSFEVLADRALVANFKEVEPEVIAYELNGGELPTATVPTQEELWASFKTATGLDTKALSELSSPVLNTIAGLLKGTTWYEGFDVLEWKWLKSYIQTIQANQAGQQFVDANGTTRTVVELKDDISSDDNWRFAVAAFFAQSQYVGWPTATADFTEAGKPEAWGAAYQAAHAVVLPTEPVDAPYTLPTPVKEGYKFVGWYDNAEGTGEPMTVIPAGWDGTLYAIWVEIYTITVEAENGTVEGAGNYEHGAEATLTATAAEGYEFTCWTSGKDTVSTANPYKLTVTADVALVANFKEAAPTYDLELVAKDLYSASDEVKTQFEGSNSLNPDMTISVTLFASKYGTYTSTGAEEDEFNAFYAGSQILGELTYSYSDELKSDLVVIIGTITDEEETSTIKVTMYEEYLEPTDVVVLNNLQKNVQKMGWMSNLMLFNAANDTIITISGCDGTYGKYSAWGTFGADELEGKGEWKNDGENDVFVGVLYNADKTKVFQVTATTPAEKIKEYTYELADVSFTLSEASNTLIIEAYAEEPEPVQVYLELAGWTPEQTIYAVGEMYGSIANMDNIEGADVANLTYEVESYLEGKELTITAQVEDATGNTYLLILTGEYDSTTTALDNLNTTVAPVKMIENGQLIIINNGVQFNAQGQVIK